MKLKKNKKIKQNLDIIGFEPFINTATCVKIGRWVYFDNVLTSPIYNVKVAILIGSLNKNLMFYFYLSLQKKHFNFNFNYFINSPPTDEYLHKSYFYAIKN